MRLFGLIGYPLTHSFSKVYFTNKFEQEGLNDCKYESFPISTIGELKNILLDHPELEGLNVTIPYKQQVISFLHRQSPVVSLIGACNCIKITGGQLYGYNTDVAGFKQSFEKHLQPYHKKALILGTGGASKAVEYVLSQLGIRFQVVSRAAGKVHLNYDQLSREIIEDHLIIINTTPLGTSPNTEAAPNIPFKFITSKHYLFDVVYNPAKTKFLRMGEERGATIQNGSEMLNIQAEESWKIWNDLV